MLNHIQRKKQQLSEPAIYYYLINEPKGLITHMLNHIQRKNQQLSVSAILIIIIIYLFNF